MGLGVGIVSVGLLELAYVDAERRVVCCVVESGC